MGNRSFAGEVQPEFTSKQSIQPIDKNLICDCPISVPIEREVAYLAPTKTSARTINRIHRLVPMMRTVQVAEVWFPLPLDRTDCFVSDQSRNFKSRLPHSLKFDYTGRCTKTGHDARRSLGTHREVIIAPPTVDRFIAGKQFNLIPRVLCKLLYLFLVCTRSLLQ